MRTCDSDIDIYFSDILLYKEKCKISLIYDISYKTLRVAKPLCISTMK